MWKTALPFLAAACAVGLRVMPGGIMDKDVNNEGVQSALNFSVSQHNNGHNDTYLHKVIEVIKAQAQVVAGMKYFINVNLAKTTCMKDSENELCDIQTDPQLAQTFQCNFTVWSRPWLNDIRLLKHTCVENNLNLTLTESS
ncbi:cystatin-C [Nematolebias whitei]|uniref:cystatin-C n=1 Tax=Nematolebias whitei TaxID=451745 RepID=UPI001896AE2B|nr:cystatin-C [Nematolebias whitei]